MKLLIEIVTGSCQNDHLQINEALRYIDLSGNSCAGEHASRFGVVRWAVTE